MFTNHVVHVCFTLFKASSCPFSVVCRPPDFLCSHNHSTPKNKNRCRERAWGFNAETLHLGLEPRASRWRLWSTVEVLRATWLIVSQSRWFGKVNDTNHCASRDFHLIDGWRKSKLTYKARNSAREVQSEVWYSWKLSAFLAQIG